MNLMRALAVRRAFAGLLHGAHTAEPIAGRPGAIPVIIEQRMLGGEASVRFIKICRLAAGRDVGLEERGLGSPIVSAR
jgi:hypothetical protein